MCMWWIFIVYCCQGSFLPLLVTIYHLLLINHLETMFHPSCEGTVELISHLQGKECDLCWLLSQHPIPFSQCLGSRIGLKVKPNQLSHPLVFGLNCWERAPSFFFLSLPICYEVSLTLCLNSFDTAWEKLDWIYPRYSKAEPGDRERKCFEVFLRC